MPVVLNHRDLYQRVVSLDKYNVTVSHITKILVETSSKTIKMIKFYECLRIVMCKTYI